MGHIFDKLIDLRPLRQAVEEMLCQSIQEMRTINLETSDDQNPINLEEVLGKAKKKRKSQYYVTELSGWNMFDWELELQLAPEFEDVREFIQECQDELSLMGGEKMMDRMNELTEEVMDKIQEILRKKIINRVAYYFKGIKKKDRAAYPPDKKIPGLKVVAEEIGVSAYRRALVLNAKGLLNSITAKKIGKLVKRIIDPHNPYIILDLNKVKNMDPSSVEYLQRLQKGIQALKGYLTIVLIHEDFRDILLDNAPDLSEFLYLDRGGAVSSYS